MLPVKTPMQNANTPQPLKTGSGGMFEKAKANMNSFMGANKTVPSASNASPGAAPTNTMMVGRADTSPKNTTPNLGAAKMSIGQGLPPKPKLGNGIKTPGQAVTGNLTPTNPLKPKPSIGQPLSSTY